MSCAHPLLIGGWEQFLDGAAEEVGVLPCRLEWELGIEAVDNAADVALSDPEGGSDLFLRHAGQVHGRANSVRCRVCRDVSELLALFRSKHG